MKYSIALVLSALVALSACQSLQVKTFNDKAAIAYATVSAVYDTTATLLRAGSISKDDAQNILKQADNVRDSIDIAKSLYTAKDASANDKLATAIKTLEALQTYLAKHQ